MLISYSKYFKCPSFRACLVLSEISQEMTDAFCVYFMLPNSSSKTPIITYYGLSFTGFSSTVKVGVRNQCFVVKYRYQKA